MNDLPFGDAYGNISIPSPFAQAMVNDCKNWAHPKTVRADQQTIARVIANVVMPRFVSLRQWRKHVSDHLGRLCTHRRKFEDETEKIVNNMGEQLIQTERIISQLKERTNQNNDYIHKLRDTLKETKKRVKELERRHHKGRSSSPDPERGANPGRGRAPDTEGGRSNFDDDYTPKARKLQNVILEAQFEAIHNRSRSPGRDAAAVWREYSNSPAPQRRGDG